MGWPNKRIFYCKTRAHSIARTRHRLIFVENDISLFWRVSWRNKEKMSILWVLFLNFFLHTVLNRLNLKFRSHSLRRNLAADLIIIVYINKFDVNLRRRKGVQSLISQALGRLGGGGVFLPLLLPGPCFVGGWKWFFLWWTFCCYALRLVSTSGWFL